MSPAASLAPAPPLLWQVGVNVPWSVSWTGEQLFHLKPSAELPGYMELTQAQNPGIGAPNFAAQHVSRNRAGMIEQLCHVCGRRTLKRDRFIFPVQSGGIVTMPDESLRYAGNVPPVHLACAKRALTLRPHLSNHYADPVAYPGEESRMMPRTDVMPGLEEFAQTLPQGAHVVSSCYRLYGPRFSGQVLRLRRAHAARDAL